MKTRLFGLLTLVTMMTMCGCAGNGTQEVVNDVASTKEAIEGDTALPEKVVIEKCTQGNPVVGDSDNLIYGGDPSVLVDGDVAYLYTGHDASTDEEVKKAIYNIPEYLCYSSTDMVNWSSEGVVMNMKDVLWASNDTSAWASQVAKYNDQYYLYYCTWDKTGKQCIGVAVADKPTGEFVDIGQPLVKGSVTKPATSSFNDIDPTVWIDTDENGREHRYLAWGNGIFYICELNEDMISVRDVNEDGKITSGKEYGQDDIVARTTGLDSYTEAPWLYRRQDENGNFYGKYYLFFAHKWRECMAYVTTDDLLNGKWSATKVIMDPTATSNTNHMAVVDFKGQTYFVYHDGALPKGNGYRRSACIQKLNFTDDGEIEFMEETTSGLSDKKVQISLGNGANLEHKAFTNSLSDSDYPYVDIELGIGIGGAVSDSQWVIRLGKADRSNENYITIESENKTGLFITTKKDGSVVLMHDTTGEESLYAKQTFKTVTGLADKEGISFESVFYEGEYLTIVDGVLTRTNGEDAEGSTFYIQ